MLFEEKWVRPFECQPEKRPKWDSFWQVMSILLLAAIGVKLIGPHGGLQVDKEAVTEVTRVAEK